MKIGPCDWSLTDEEAMERGLITPSQETAIELALEEVGASDGAVNGDEMGYGKTVQGTEIIVRGIRRHGWTRALLIGLPNTHTQWADCLREQSDGEVEARIMDGSKTGRENYAAFMKHVPGVYIAGSAYLQEKDWESRIQRDETGRVLFKVNKKTNQLELTARKDGAYPGEMFLVDREEGEIGPAQEPQRRTRGVAGAVGPAFEPVPVRKSVRKEVYARFHRKPLDAIVFDEVQAIANRKAKGRQTILSIKASFRVAMSGTWFNNKVENQWSIARWVWPGTDEVGMPWVETNFSRWSERFLLREDVTGRGGKAIENGFGGTVKKVTGERIPGEFASGLPCYIRRENKIRVPDALVIECEPLPEQRRQMEELREELMAWVMSREGFEVPLVVEMPPTLRMRLRQVAIAALSIEGEWPNERVIMQPDAEAGKLAPLRYLLEERWKGQRAAIYTDSKIGAYFMAQRMQRGGANVALWTGDLSKKQRDQMKLDFIAGKYQYLIATVQSIGVGIDGLQKVCNKVAWISHADGNPSANDQAIRRFRRHGFIVTDPNHPDGGFEHVRILLNDPLDKEGLQALVDKAWGMRMALNAGQEAA